MDVRQLRRFLYICEYGSLLQASEHKFISQQALSKSLIALEKEVGAPLFHRTSRGLELTEVGLAMRQYAPRVVAAMDELEQTIDNVVKTAGNKITIGLANGLQPLLSSSIRNRLKAEFPDLDITIQEHHFLECESLTAQGSLTLSLVNGPVAHPALKKIRLTDGQRVVILPKDHPLAGRRSIHLRDLRDCPLALNINNRCYDELLLLCRRRGFVPNVQRVSDTITMLNLCSTEGYIGIFPGFLLSEFSLASSNLIVRPMAGNEFSYPIDLAVNPNRYEQKAVSELCDEIALIVRQVVWAHPVG